MRSVFRQILLVLTLLLPIGCRKAEPAVQSMMHQVLGALQIPNKVERDSALAAACRECASSRDIESVMLGLPKISDAKQRDAVAEECFQIFLSDDRKDDAKRVGELIDDPVNRSRILALLNETTDESSSQ